MNIILCIIGYFLIGFIVGFIICKIMGKEWCRANISDTSFVMIISTFFWVFLVLFSPCIIIYYFITYTVKKLQE